MDITDLEMLGLEELVGEEELVGDELDDLLSLVSGEEEDLMDLIMGDDYGDEVGAARRRFRRLLRRSRGRGGRGRTRAGGSLGAKLIARKLAKSNARQMALSGGVASVPVSPKKGRVLLLGGQETQGAVAGLLQISTTAQELARVDRLFITGRDDTGAVLPPASYNIANIQVGTVSQFAALPPLPGVMFQADATGQGYALGLDTIQPGTDFTVSIADAPALSTFTFGCYATALR